MGDAMTPENLKPKFGNAQMKPISPEQIIRNLDHGYAMTRQEQSETATYIRHLQQKCLGNGMKELKPVAVRNKSAPANTPELLEALKSLLEDITEYQTINNLKGEHNHSQLQARAAINKAEEQS